jgi:WD40 repeat protein
MRHFRVVLLLVPALAVATPAAAQGPRLDRHGDPLPEGAIARLGSVRFQPPRRIYAAALSPDGSILAAADHGTHQDGIAIDLLDAATGKVLRTVRLTDWSGNQIEFTPDGKSLLYSGYAGLGRYDLATGKCTWSLEDNRAASAFALSADGKRVAIQPTVFVKHAPVHVWEMAGNTRVAVLPGRGASCNGLRFSADGKRLLLWSRVPDATANAITISNDSLAALASIDLGTGQVVGETTAAPSQSVALGPDGETVALEDADHLGVRILHLPSGVEKSKIAVRQAKVALAPDGKTLLTIDLGGRGALWDALKGVKLRDLEGNLVHADYRLLGFSANGKTIAVLEGGWRSAQSFVVWDAATGKRAPRPPGHEAAVTCLAYALDGKRLVSGSLDKTVRLWDADTGEHLRVLARHKDSITAVALSPDGKLVASSSEDGRTRVSQVADGKAVADLDGPERGAATLTFAPDGKTLYAGGRSPQVLAWQFSGANEVVRLKTGNDGSVMSFTPGGALALTANGEIRDEANPERLLLWNTSNKLLVGTISLRNASDPHGRVRCEAALCSPDGRLIAVSQVSEYQGERPSYGAALLRVWERVSGQPVRTLGPTVTNVLAFAPNGRLLASGGKGRSGHLRVGYGAGIDFWDVVTGKRVATLPVSPDYLAFSPQGAQLATAGREQTILLWDAPRLRPPQQSREPSAAQREAWWIALGSNARDAYQAIGAMFDAPDTAVALLKEHVAPVQAQDAQAVRKLIALLDSNKFAEREKAKAALEKMGEGALGTINAALAGTITIEMRNRLEALVRRCEATSTADLRQHRAVAALEWLGTPAARALLQALAVGAADARLTTEAQAALKRLQA